MVFGGRGRRCCNGASAASDRLSDSSARATWYRSSYRQKIPSTTMSQVTYVMCPQLSVILSMRSQFLQVHSGRATTWSISALISKDSKQPSLSSRRVRIEGRRTRDREAVETVTSARTKVS